MDLTHASREWSSRPADERFVNLEEMRQVALASQARSREVVVSTKELNFTGNVGQLLLHGPNGHGYTPTHWAFGQASTLVGAPAAYLRKLSTRLAAENLNEGLATLAKQDVKVLIEANGTHRIRALTGPDYGRIWDHAVIGKVIEHFGDGVNGDFRVPGKWGKALDAVTVEDTTLYRGDRSMFIFLADEANKIEIKNRRAGKPGALSRGFFLWQSEVRAAVFGIGSFLFDYVCGNRIVWGAEDYCEVRLRHTKSAPDRWAQMIDALAEKMVNYRESSERPVAEVIAAAQRTRIETDKLPVMLETTFGKANAKLIALAHLTDEDRPMETIWDVVTGATAFARSIGWQEERVEIERLAGGLLDKVVVN